jgi:methylated-DNA-[protein]-cysteine S-methyltransferase
VSLDDLKGKQINKMEQIQYQMKSKIGPLYIVASKDGFHGVFFNKQPIKLVKKLGMSKPEEKTLSKVVGQLEEYFAGQRKRFDLTFNLSGTHFQKQVWRELFKIPFGKTVSYKDIAQRIKNPKAVRAVGSANGKNPVCIIIPCHRVIAADGSIGGYSGGLHKKRQLLKLEGIKRF